jgi:hypothetical protein
MKKLFLIIVYILFGVSMAACKTSTSEESTTTEQHTNLPTNEEPTTVEPTTVESTTETTTQITFTPVDSATVENDQASFFVRIDSNTINDSNPVITVAVEITTTVVINQTLETSSYGDEGLIRIRIVSVANEDILLYSEFYDIPFTDDEYDVNLNIGEELARIIQFARMPFHGGYGGEEPSPTGTYKIQVALFAPEMIWIDTDLLITVE